MTQIAVKKCKQCGKELNLSDSEIDFFKKKGLNIPKRCKECRIKNKKDSNKTANANNQNPQSIESSSNKFQKIIIILIILLPFITATTAYLTSQSDKQTTIPPTISIIQKNNQPLNIEPQPQTEAKQQPKELPQPSKKLVPVYLKTSANLQNYVLNTYRNKFHRTYCHSVREMNARNRENYHGTREEIIKMGYKPCNDCRP